MKRKPDRFDKKAERMWPTIKANFNLEPGYVNSLVLIARALRTEYKRGYARGVLEALVTGKAGQR